MKKNRFFGGCMQMQANWLNRMAAQGWRLVRTGKLVYEFEPCEPGAVQYCVEYVADQSRAETVRYEAFLEELGYRVFEKNINLQWSVMKVRCNPWAKPGARIVTDATTLDRELLIVEKENDGKPFELYTTLEDRVDYYKRMRTPWLWVMVCLAAAAVVLRSWACGGMALLCLAAVLRFSAALWQVRRQGMLEESGVPPVKRRPSLRPWLLPVFIGAMVLLLVVQGVPVSRGLKIGYTESSWGRQWRASYHSFSGTASRRLSTAAGDTIRVEIETKSGRLDLEVTASDGTVVYHGEDLESGAFEIPVEGAVTVKLTAESHKGSFRLNWQRDGA